MHPAPKHRVLRAREAIESRRVIEPVATLP
jgi:hypothetical protein